MNPTIKNQYVPGGSYLLSSNNIRISINANCKNAQGCYVSSRLTYSIEEALSIGDIINNEGILAITMGAHNNTINKYNEFLPVGSYQLLSKDITVTLIAKCKDAEGNWEYSTPITFYAIDAFQIKDISNRNGQLFIAR